MATAAAAKSASKTAAPKKRTNVKAAVEKAIDPYKARVRRLSAAVKSEKARTVIDKVETVGGGLAAGVMHGAGVDLEFGERSVPIGLPLGVAGLVAGSWLGQRDVCSVGLGLLTFGAGRAAEDVVADAMAG